MLHMFIGGKRGFQTLRVTFETKAMKETILLSGNTAILQEKWGLLNIFIYHLC